MNIAMIMKLISLAGMFKDVTEEARAAGADGRPWYTHRTVLGAIGTAVTAAVAGLLGVSLDPQVIGNITDNIPQLIAVVGTLYSSVLMVYGAIMKAVKAVKSK